MRDTIDSQGLALAPLLARRELWLLVSAGYADPYQQERFGILRDPAFRRRAVEAAALLREESKEVPLGPGELDPRALSPDSLFTALDAERENLETSYRDLFGLTAFSANCPPCGIEYEPNPDVAFRSQRLADVAAFYRAFGLQVSSRAGERLDHITVQAEFLYFLLAKEVAALEEQNQEGVEVSRDARSKFFEEHVGWWLPIFARRLSEAAPSGYFKELARLTAGMSALERVNLGLPPFSARIIPKPSPPEVEGGCFNCLSHQQIS
jgi:TorA maturation chaperone TorD